MSNLRAIVIDTEATQINEPELVEVAIVPLRLYPGKVIYKQVEPLACVFERRYQPDNAIQPGAIAVHKITNAMVKGSPPSSSFSLPDETVYIVGHNIDFDARVIGVYQPPEKEQKVKRICTLALARYLFPEWDGHTLGACIISLYGEDKGLEIIGNAHSARDDTLATTWLMHALIDHIEDVYNKKVNAYELLYRMSERARFPRVMRFGKHKGMPVDEVPVDYRQWYAGQDDLDYYLLAAWGLA